jgi:hypothetical protein
LGPGVLGLEGEGEGEEENGQPTIFAELTNKKKI